MQLIRQWHIFSQNYLISYKRVIYASLCAWSCLRWCLFFSLGSLVLCCLVVIDLIEKQLSITWVYKNAVSCHTLHGQTSKQTAWIFSVLFWSVWGSCSSQLTNTDQRNFGYNVWKMNLGLYYGRLYHKMMVTVHWQSQTAGHCKAVYVIIRQPNCGLG